MEKNSEKSSRTKVQQSILSFVKSKQLKSRISEDEDGNSEGIQALRQPEFRSSNDNIAAIPKVTEKGGPCSTTSNEIRVKIIPYTQNRNYQKVNSC